MSDTAALLSTTVDLLLVIFGFGMIIFLHELGHFLAARWAGIRVMAFAIGFGPALVSFRKGFGLVKGSSEPRFLAAADRGEARGVSPTEYRLNVLPFGGYVKMLGQDDADPTAVSDAPDSYQRCKVWKRMVVISAGVIANLVTAALLFVFVFMVGLRTEPPLIGRVEPGSAAAKAVATNGEAMGVVAPGLQPGDAITSVNGKRPRSFNDLVLASAMARRGDEIRLTVERDGVARPLHFSVLPEVSELSKLLELGVEPARSNRLFSPKRRAEGELFAARLGAMGFAGVEPGMALIAAGPAGDVRPVRVAAEIESAAQRAAGREMEFHFAHEGEEAVVIARAKPRARLQQGLAPGPGGKEALVEHLLGFVPLMTVADAGVRGAEQGLRAGDVFVRLGTVEYPSLLQGISEIRAHKGRSIDIVVRRKDREGEREVAREVSLRASVTSKGTIGFAPGETTGESAELATPLASVREVRRGAEPAATPASGLRLLPGSVVLSAAGQEIANFNDLRAALLSATAPAHRASGAAAVEVRVAEPIPSAEGGERLTRRLTLDLSLQDIRALHELGWSSPLSVGAFEPVQSKLKADGPIDAVRTGLHETHRVMMMTYTTFLRLFEGSVKVEHLKGPVGIAHLGTMVADRGLIWLVFFLALISVNLAVINFLPLPIVDGGQFIFLLLEQIRGRPVPAAVQNVATLAGLALIGSVFLIVTFNDVANLFGR